MTDLYRLSGVLVDGSWSGVTRTKVRATLVDPGSGKARRGWTGDGIAVRSVEVPVDETGAWELSLPASADVTPEGSGWAVYADGQLLGVVEKAAVDEDWSEVTILAGAPPMTPAELQSALDRGLVVGSDAVAAVDQRIDNLGPGDVGADPAGSAAAAAAASVARAGDSMAGPLDLAGHRLTGLPAPAADADPARREDVTVETAARISGDGVLTGRAVISETTLTDLLDMVGRVTVDAETVVVSDGARKGAGLPMWIDGLIGRAEIGGEVHCWAPNGPMTARWVLDPNGFIDRVESTDVTFPATGYPDTGYAAGGPIISHDGRLWMIYHGERYPMGDGGASGFWSYLGLATTVVSDPDGWVDLGPIVTPTLPYVPGTPAQAEIGGGTFAILDFAGAPHVVVFYKDTTADGVWQGMGLAACPLADVHAATTAAPSFVKLGPSGFSPGIGGESLDLLPAAAPNPWWMDIIHLVDHDRLVMIYHAPETDGSGDALWMRTAPASDAARWSAPQRLTAPEDAEIIYASVWSPDDPVSRAPTGDTLTVTYVRSRSGWPRDQVPWDRWADAEVAQRTLTWQSGPVDGTARGQVAQVDQRIDALGPADVGADPAGTAAGLVAGTVARDGSRGPTANLSMGGHKIAGLGAPTVAGDAVRIDDMLALRGNTMLRDGTQAAAANLSMGGHRLTGLAAPVDAGDAARLADIPAAGTWQVETSLLNGWTVPDPDTDVRWHTDGIHVWVDIPYLAPANWGSHTGAIFVLPVGCRPDSEERTVAMWSDGTVVFPGRCAVYPTGAVHLATDPFPGTPAVFFGARITIRIA